MDSVPCRWPPVVMLVTATGLRWKEHESIADSSANLTKTCTVERTGLGREKLQALRRNLAAFAKKVMRIL
jgi:hypothetical protein